MKIMFIATALTATLMCAAALAQSATPSAADPAQAPRIAPGTVIPVELTKTVDAKKAKAGDEVFAKVSRDLKTNSGEILVSERYEGDRPCHRSEGTQQGTKGI